MCNWNVSIFSLIYIFAALYSCLIFCYFQAESDRTEQICLSALRITQPTQLQLKSPACFSNCFFFFLLASHLAEIETTQKALKLF